MPTHKINNTVYWTIEGLELPNSKLVIGIISVLVNITSEFLKYFLWFVKAFHNFRVINLNKFYRIIRKFSIQNSRHHLIFLI